MDVGANRSPEIHDAHTSNMAQRGHLSPQTTQQQRLSSDHIPTSQDRPYSDPNGRYQPNMQVTHNADKNYSSHVASYGSFQQQYVHSYMMQPGSDEMMTHFNVPPPHHSKPSVRSEMSRQHQGHIDSTQISTDGLEMREPEFRTEPSLLQLKNTMAGNSIPANETRGERTVEVKPNQTITVINRRGRSKLIAMRRKKYFADLAFTFPSGQDIWAHKALVCEYSRHIMQMCINSMQSMDPHYPQSPIVINLSDIEGLSVGEDIVNMALDFIYGKDLDITLHDHDELMKLALKLDMPDLTTALTESAKSDALSKEIISPTVKDEDDLHQLEPEHDASYEKQPKDYGMVETKVRKNKQKKSPVKSRTLRKTKRGRKPKSKSNAKHKRTKMIEPEEASMQEAVDKDEEDNVEDTEGIAFANDEDYMAPESPEASSDEAFEDGTAVSMKNSQILKITGGESPLGDEDMEDTDTNIITATGKNKQNRAIHKRKLICNKCKMEFGEIQTLVRHKVEEHNMFPCERCKRCFDSEDMLKIHEVTHSGMNPYVRVLSHYPYVREYICNLCDKSYTVEKAFLDHRVQEHDVKVVKCLLCTKSTFINTWNLSVHLYKHHLYKGQGKDICQYCGKIFLYRKYMLKHMRMKHELEDKYVCSHCGRRFTYEHMLKKHAVIHLADAEKQFSCTVCNKKLATKQQLKYHMHSHSKPFQCIICGKTFARKFHLKRHMQVMHSDETPEEDLIINGAKMSNISMAPTEPTPEHTIPYAVTQLEDFRHSHQMTPQMFQEKMGFTYNA